MVHTAEKGWTVSQEAEDFFVSQTFRSNTGERIAVLQTLHRAKRRVDLPPETEILEVAGHSAFLRRDVPVAEADVENEARPAG